MLICVVLPGVQLQFTVPLSGGKLGLCHYDYNRVTLSLLTIQIIALHCYTRYMVQLVCVTKCDYVESRNFLAGKFRCILPSPIIYLIYKKRFVQGPAHVMKI